MAALMRRRAPAARTTVMPAPTGGWDASSPYVDIPADRAIELVNLIPQRGRIVIRGGFAPHATGMTGPVDTLMTWNGPAGASKLFAANNGSIYDVTSAGAVGAASVSGLASNRWQHVNFGTAGGAFLWCCNGADAPRHFNGSAWATPSITGVTAADIIGVFAHHRRLFFALKNSASFGYLPVESVAGAVSTVNLAPLWPDGGHLVAGGSWTFDGGSGMDDHAVFVSSKGEVAVYQGTDPADAANWSLVGVYRIARPIGRRCLFKAGGDLGVITVDGVVSLAAVQRLERAQADKAAVTSRLRDAYAAAALTAETAFGWQAIQYPEQQLLLINVPVTEGASQYQMALNVMTGAWCRIDGLKANCWAALGAGLYFGGNDGRVHRAFTGTDDDGAEIAWTARTGFGDLGHVGRIKHVKMVRPIVETDGLLAPAIGIDVDYRVETPMQSAAYSQAGTARYDTAVYDAATYAGAAEAQTQWVGVGAVGRAISVHIRGASKGVTGAIAGFDVIYELGGMLG